MAKKIKRQYSRSDSAAGVGVPVRERQTPSAAKSTVTMEFNPDYSHVRKDLTKIGVLAASFISILVILSFFLK